MNASTSAWLLLLTTLPSSSGTPRMRVWRALKALGCGALRDGAWLLPAGRADGGFKHLERLAGETVAAGGTAELLLLTAVDDAQETRFRSLFDRSADYAQVLDALRKAAAELPDAKTVLALQRELKGIAATDFFPGEAKRQAETALAELEALSSGEPRFRAGAIRRLDAAGFRRRTWATRRHLWIDRMASAWLIRRFIDREARFVWLARAEDCPAGALGFDFDGAAFTHVDGRVTFEVLLASFALDADPALARLAELVHYLDVGGIPVAEAPGVERVLSGARALCGNDDALLDEVSHVFDSLYLAHKESDHD
ncbi:MAG: chromate resistance protein [Betaproteobacteria bacterium]|nr:chromate resistance protein [Betaproteobacteria bacterium]